MHKSCDVVLVSIWFNLNDVTVYKELVHTAHC